ncbi:MAG TPA: PAS domain-containing protein [Polyangiaceae bacterium]|nr:PAS domain-containing protein [Polyangiaceae bacterium]
MRDLVALSTLPAIWIGLDPNGIAGSLADVLLNTLSLDLVYIRLSARAGEGVVEVFRSKHRYEGAGDDAVRTSFASLLRFDEIEPPVTVPHPFGVGTLHVAVTRFGVGENQGVLVAGSRNADFPSEQDRLLLGVGANQTAIVVQRRRAEEQTHEQRERLRVTLASIGDAVLTTDTEGRVTFLNPIAEALTGWTLEEAAGRPLEAIFEIINEANRAPVENPVTKVLREGKVVGLANHTLLIAKDRTERPIDDSAAPIRGKEGEIVGCVLVFRDISEKKDAEREVRQAGEQARTILESITDAFFALDQDWRFTYVNRQAEKVLDRAKDELLGRVIWDEYPGMRASEFERAFQRAAKDRVACSVTSYYPDHARWYEIHAYPATTGVSIYFRDATEQKQAEKDRTALLAAAQAANRAKDEFMAILGHELRNPLSPIMTALHVLRLRGVEGGERERAVIERQVHHLVRLIDDLLDVSRITGGKIELKKERLEVAEIVARAVETASPLLEQKQHQLVVDVPRSGLTVTGDPARLAQVVSNLLINAAKYTDAAGRIQIQGARRGPDVVIDVTDNGSGIAPELLPRVFEMFVQEHQGIDRSQGGLGLGLAIVRNIVLLHGGTTTAESAGLGRGSTFTIRLPACTDAQPTALAVPSSSPELPGSKASSNGHRGRVLIVDDNVDSAEMMAEVLAIAGYEVQTAHDGPEALTLVEDFVPDIALLDIGLPSMSGYELARGIRDQVPRARLVAVTGYGQEADRVRARAAGFDAHLVKPVDLARLEKMMSDFAIPAAKADNVATGT